MTRFAALLRQLCWLGALGLVLAALYVSLGRQLTPLVAEYRSEVQAGAQRLLAMPLRLGRLEGRWEGFAPRLLAHDVQLGDGESAVYLDRLILVPDVAASLWARELRLVSLGFEGVRLSLIEDAEGRWRVEGLPQRAEQPPADLQKLLEAVQRLPHLALVDSQLTLTPYDAAPQTLTYANLNLRSSAERLRLDGRVTLPDGQPLSLQLRARVQPQHWRQAEVELYLNLPQSDWAAWLPRRLTGDWQLQRLRAGGEVWVDWREQALARAVLRLKVPQLRGAYAERAPVQLDDLTLNGYVEHSVAGYRLLLDKLAFSLDGQRWEDSQLALEQDRAAGRWRLQTDQLRIAPLASLAGALLPLPATAAETLAGLAPQGTLRNLQLDYQPAAALLERFALSANLEAVSIAAHQWIPAARNVSGSVEGGLGAGTLRFDNPDFSLHLARMFPQPWAYRRSQGSLNWRFDDQALTLAAPYLRLEGEEGQLAGDFLIRLMHDPDAEDYMDLRVGLSEGDARFTEKYLPTLTPALGPALVDWLSTAIRGGTVDQGYFQYQGSLRPGAAVTERNLSLYFKLRDAELAFQPGWPILREGRGEVLIDNSGVRVRLAEARLLDSRVRDAVALIPRAESGKPPRLRLEGQVEGDLADALKLLQVAPIGTAQMFAGWRGEGALSTTLDLDIPLAAGARPHAVVDFSSRAATLQIASPALRIEQLAGSFRYDSDKGFSATQFQGRALGGALRGKAVATGSPGSPATRIEAQGALGVKRLADWLQVSQPLPVSGELPYQLRLELGGGNPQLQVDSSLRGVAIDLPAPFGKSAATRRDTSLRMSLGADQRRYAVKHGNLAALVFTTPNGRWAEGGGELVLGGGAANTLTGRGLRVRGTLERLDWAAWQAVLQRHVPEAEGPATASLLQRARLRIARFEGFGTRIDGLDVDLRRLADAWSLQLGSQTIGGTIRLPDAQRGVVDVRLRHLRLPAAEAGKAQTERTDPLAAVDPRSLRAMDIAIDRVWQGDTPLGAWSLKMRPASNGVVFPALDLGLKGLRVTGSGGWRNAQSWYKGRLQGGNLADVLLAWGFAPSTTSDSFRVDVDGRWPGSPAFFGLERFSGRLDARLDRGQFSEIEGGAQALRVFGLLNFNSIGRRLRLDFSDLFGKGLSYDRIKGLLVATDGIFVTDDPITITGPSSNLELDGQMDMVNNRINATLLVTLPVSNNLPLAALIVGAPAIGGALFVFDKLLGDRVARFASVQYTVEGPWQSPQITFDKPFEKPN